MITTALRLYFHENSYALARREIPLKVGEIGVLQTLRRVCLNGPIAEATDELKKRMLYSISNPADSEICLSYRVRIPGFSPASTRIEMCVKQHRLRRNNNPDCLQPEAVAMREKS